MLSCNCDVFCPCVISLGKANPSQGACHTWWGLHIDEGHSGDEKLDGLNAAMLMDIPGPLAHGDWTLGLYLDERASPAAGDALTEILTGKAGGTTSWFKIVVSEFLGVKKVPIRTCFRERFGLLAKIGLRLGEGHDVLALEMYGRE